MKQYNAIKAKYPDALLLFRVGDFYETFGSDKEKAAKILDIILTKRGAGSQSETELVVSPFFEYLFAKISQSWRTCGHLRPVGRSKTNQNCKTCYRTHHSGYR